MKKYKLQLILTGCGTRLQVNSEPWSTQTTQLRPSQLRPSEFRPLPIQTPPQFRPPILTLKVESLAELKFNPFLEVKMTQFFSLRAPREKIESY